MKKYTKQEIDSARKWMENKGFQEIHANLSGLEFDYFILPQSLNPSLPSFIYRCTGNNGEGCVFGISDNVPEEFRPYAVAHEVIEFNHMELTTKGRCVQALEKEISLVPLHIKKPYIEMRRDFFKYLVNYAKNNPANYTEEDIQEFEGSLNKLEELAGGEN